MSGYRYSVDPFLLADFATIKAGEVAADLGTGGAILPLLLCHLYPVARIYAVELQPSFLEEAEALLDRYGLRQRVQLVSGDVRQIRDILAAQSCNVVLSNPPYRPAGEGRLARDGQRAAARHELNGGLEDFLSAAAFLLGDGGRFYGVYLAERLAELIQLMKKARLEPKRLRCVHGREGAEAKIILVEGRKNARPGLKVDAPLFVYCEEEHGEEMRSLMERFRQLWG